MRNKLSYVIALILACGSASGASTAPGVSLSDTQARAADSNTEISLLESEVESLKAEVRTLNLEVSRLGVGGSSPSGLTGTYSTIAMGASPSGSGLSTLSEYTTTLGTLTLSVRSLGACTYQYVATGVTTTAGLGLLVDSQSSSDVDVSVQPTVVIGATAAQVDSPQEQSASGRCTYSSASSNLTLEGITENGAGDLACKVGDSGNMIVCADINGDFTRTTVTAVRSP